MPTAKWQICIPTNQLIALVRWFHGLLGHCGIHRLCNSITTNFSHPRLRATADNVIKHCRACQINKLTGPGYGKLPPREATALPFQEVAIELIGPWRVTLPNETYEFYALTCIGMATNFPEAMSACSLRTYGWLDILGQCTVYMTKAPNLSVLTFSTS
jgi:hypothetical protein